MSRSPANMLDDCKACAAAFPADIGVRGDINEPLKLLLFCQKQDSVDKVISAISCEQGLLDMCTAEERELPEVASLSEQVGLAKKVLADFAESALKLVVGGLSQAADAAATGALSAAAAGSAFKGLWQLARACQARLC